MEERERQLTLTRSHQVLVMDNAAIHKVHEVQSLIETRGYKATYLPPYSPFLNPIALFWSKVKGSIRRDCLTVDDNLTTRIIDSVKMCRLKTV